MNEPIYVQWRVIVDSDNSSSSSIDDDPSGSEGPGGALLHWVTYFSLVRSLVLSFQVSVTST